MIRENNSKKYYKIIIDYKKHITRLNTSSIIIIIKSFLSKIWGSKSWSFKGWYKNINSKKNLLTRFVSFYFYYQLIPMFDS